MPNLRRGKRKLHSNAHSHVQLLHVRLLRILRKMKDYEAALENIQIVYQITEARYGYKSEQTAMTFIEQAKIYACQEDWAKAIDF